MSDPREETPENVSPDEERPAFPEDEATEGAVATDLPDNATPDEERPVYDEDERVLNEDIPASDAAIPTDALPQTQDDDPVLADLGAEGQGDLAPEDDPRLRGERDAPDDLRSEL